MDIEFSGMGIADKRLHSITAITDRPCQQTGERRHREFFGIEVELYAKRTADIGADNPDFVLCQTQMLGVKRLHKMR